MRLARPSVSFFGHFRLLDGSLRGWCVSGFLAECELVGFVFALSVVVHVESNCTPRSVPAPRSLRVNRHYEPRNAVNRHHKRVYQSLIGMLCDDLSFDACDSALIRPFILTPPRHRSLEGALEKAQQDLQRVQHELQKERASVLALEATIDKLGTNLLHTVDEWFGEDPAVNRH